MNKKSIYLSVAGLVLFAFGVLWTMNACVKAAAPGSLVKASTPAVYYLHSDGKRYVFPDEKTFFTWYQNFDQVQTVSDQELASMPIGGLVLYRPATRLIKITTDPKVYAVGSGGALRWVSGEQVAVELFGADWARRVNDLSDAFFGNYSMGSAIVSPSDYDEDALLGAYPTISHLLGGTIPEPPVTPPPSTAGPTVYVSPTGNDANNGTEAYPFQTINHALEAADPGTTIMLKPGTYQQNEVRIRQPNITLTSAGPSRAIIKAPLPATEYDGDVAVMIDVDADGTVLRNLEITGGFYAVSLETRWDWGEADRSGVSNVLIENCSIHDMGRDAVKVKPNADHVTIRNNQIYNTGKVQSPDDCNAEGIDNVNGDDMLVEGNEIHDICSTGVYCKGGATNCQIISNRIWNTGEGGIMVGFDTSPEYFDLAVNPGYYENIGAIVRNNLVKNTKGAGIGLYASKNALIEYNTIINSGADYHSPVYFGVTYQDWEDGAGRPANLNPTIRNNVVVQQSGHPTLMSQIRYSEDLGGLSGLQGSANLSNNCYFAATGSSRFEDNRPGMEFDGDLAGWKTHMSSESGSVEAEPGLNADDVATTPACSGKGWRP